MMEQDFNNKQWGVADFERYHSGKMPVAEMHALEKAALDDPFLEDALEGYAFTNTAIADIEELRNKLTPEQEQHKIAWYKRKAASQALKMAAILVVFLGFAWLLNKNNPAERKDRIAVVPVATPLTGSQAMSDSAEQVRVEKAPQPAGEEQQDDIKLSGEKMNPLAKQHLRELPTDAPVAAASRVPGVDQPAAADTVGIENIQFSSSPKRSAAPSVLTQPLEGKIEGVLVTNQHTIRGRVVDDAGKPVAFANISDRENNLFMAADKDGYFSLSNRQNAANVKVDVNAIGFEPNKAALSADIKENKIVLKGSDQVLNEVVVTGYGTRKKSAVRGTETKPGKELYGNTADRITLVNALPLSGWENFYRFVADSLHPKTLPATGYKEVSLQFSIDSLGKAKDIEVKKSVSDSMDAAAQQILRALPPLKLVKKANRAGVLIKL
jgi:outer membrane biosynthesis protein TonB